ncbi:MAG: phospholipase [Crocinitomicaceae bacterium]|nr:phospholipase [Crocinitomicaceae bacterium]
MEATAHNLTVQKTARWWSANPPESKPVKGTLYVLHGYGQLPRFFIRKFQQQVLDGWRVIAPEGAHRFYLEGTEGRVGASWMTKEARLDDIADQLAFLNALRKHTDAESNGGKNVLLGFSQGVSTALRWAALGKDGIQSWDGLIAHSGVIPRDLKTLEGDLSGGPSLDVLIGTEDPYVHDHSARFKTVEAAWTDAGGSPTQIRFHTFKGAHDVDAVSVAQVLNRIS